MNPSIIDQAQQQAQQGFQNDFGSTIDNLASQGSTIDQAKQALGGGSAQAPASQTPDNSNVLTRLLPTAGGIVGGLVGLPLNALDAVSGIGGTALDMGLAGLGSSAGKFLENKIEGKDAGNNVLTSGLEGAAGQGIGEGVSGLLGAGGKLLSGFAGKAAQGAADQATGDVASKVFGAIPKGLRQAHDLTGSLQLAGELGLDHTNPQSLVDAGKAANDILDTSVNDALGMAGPIDANGYYDIVKNALTTPERNVLGGIDPVAIARGRFGLPNTPAAGLLKQLNGLGEGIVGGQSDPTALRGLLQQVGKLYGDSEPAVTALTGAKDPIQVASHDALGEVYDNLKKLIYERPEVGENFAKLEGNILPEDVGGNAALAGKLNDVLGSATSHQPVLDALRQFGNLRNIGSDALTAGKGMIAKPAAAPASRLIDLGGIAEALLGHNPIAGGGIVLANHLAQNPAALQAGGGILSKLGASGIPELAGQVVGNSPNDVTGPAGAGNAISLNENPAMNPQNSVLSQALYEAMQNPLNGGLSQIGALLPAVQKVNQAQAAEQQLASEFNQAGGAQGPLGGILNRIGATLTGGEAASYPGQAQAAAEAISQATGIPVAQVESTLPSQTQNQSAAQASLGNIQSLIQALTMGQGTPGVIGAATR
jgi:hypothetical protein